MMRQPQIRLNMGGCLILGLLFIIFINLSSLKANFNQGYIALLEKENKSLISRPAAVNDSSIIFYYNSLNKKHVLVRELNWSYQVPDLILPDNESKGYKSKVTLNFDSIKNDVNYDKEDIFEVKLVSDTLILTKINQRSINDFTTHYTIVKRKKRKHVVLEITLICYSKYSTESVYTSYKLIKNAWKRISYRKEYKDIQ